MAVWKKKTKRRAKSTRRKPKEPAWVEMPDNELLDVRICDLKLKIEGTVLERRIAKLHDELEARDLNFDPHWWLAEEWFTPDGVPGIAIPFYLAHPRLMKLERKQMLEVEGGTEEWCLRILRHEAGHAIDNAYRLHLRRSWREVFGKYSQPYPEFYQPRPYSKKYVLHLDPWYAQSHPAEDFAETFAVWLKPRSRWRTRYEEWPALKKLEYVDELMEDIAGTPPLQKSKSIVDPISKIRKTLRDHYNDKRARYQIDFPNVYDRELYRLFSDDPQYSNRPTAASFLVRTRPELCRAIAHWTGQYRYTIDLVLGEIISRCRELNLRLSRSERQTQRDAIVMLTVQTMNYLHAGHHRFAL